MPWDGGDGSGEASLPLALRREAESVSPAPTMLGYSLLFVMVDVIPLTRNALAVVISVAGCNP